jgi:hypothetical protein
MKNGVNPFAHAPSEMDVQSIEKETSSIQAAELIKSRVNHPDVKTIYPPLAQLGFLLNSVIFSWNQYGCRYTFLLFDILLCIVLLKIIRIEGLSLSTILIYAWNPLVLKEVTNSMHIDILCALFIGIYIYFLLKIKYHSAFASAIAAALVKLTPATLCLPFIVFLIRSKRIRLSLLLILSLAASIAFTLIVMSWGVENPLSGYIAFFSDWETNASVFSLMKHILLTVFPEGGAIMATKAILFCFFLIFMCVGSLRIRNKEELLRFSMLVLVTLFLISPVGNPWYLIWIVPFLIIFDYTPMIVLCICTSLYYLTFHFMYRDSPLSSLHWLKLAEYLPFYTFLAFYHFRERGNTTAGKTPETSHDILCGKNGVLDIIIPVLNEGEKLRANLESVRNAVSYLEKDATGKIDVNIIVVDGGSTDDSVSIAEEFKTTVIKAKTAGRGSQTAEGVCRGNGSLVLLLHADSVMDAGALIKLVDALGVKNKIEWGVLGHRYDKSNFKMRIVRLMNRFRFRVLGIAFGDQGIFFRRGVIENAGGVPAIALMEDVEVSLRLRGAKRISLGENLTVSTRRWDRQSFLSYFCQVSTYVLTYLFHRWSGRPVDEISSALYKQYYRK